MKRLLLASASFLLLTACVDTTGISPEAVHPVYPGTSENAIVSVMEYADLQCPACRTAHTTITKEIAKKYGSRIRFEFRHYPLSSIHPYAMVAAEAAECSADQGKFWQFVDMNYEQQSKLTKDMPRTWANALGLDMDLFDRCTKSHIKRKAILAQYEEGKNNGVLGTPTYFVNGVRTEATLKALSEAIDQAIANANKLL